MHSPQAIMKSLKVKNFLGRSRIQSKLGAVAADRPKSGSNRHLPASSKTVMEISFASMKKAVLDRAENSLYRRTGNKVRTRLMPQIGDGQLQSPVPSSLQRPPTPRPQRAPGRVRRM